MVIWVTMQFGRDVGVSILYIYRHNFVRTFAKKKISLYELVSVDYSNIK